MHLPSRCRCQNFHSCCDLSAATHPIDSSFQQPRTWLSVIVCWLTLLSCDSAVRRLSRDRRHKSWLRILFCCVGGVRGAKHLKSIFVACAFFSLRNYYVRIVASDCYTLGFILRTPCEVFNSSCSLDRAPIKSGCPHPPHRARAMTGLLSRRHRSAAPSHRAPHLAHTTSLPPLT